MNPELPQYIFESGLSGEGIIAVTQPRRVAATSLAARVAKEQNDILGNRVGYTVRFDERISEKTRIKFTTDGMLVRELIGDPMLSRYSVVIIDEAHERTLRTDLLITQLKTIRNLRNTIQDYTLPSNPVKIILMSATLDAERFSTFYSG